MLRSVAGITEGSSSDVRSAAQAARAIASGATSARELLEVTLSRIRRFNPALNAVVTLDAEGSRTLADRADEAVREGRPVGALHGVPMTIKDAFDTAGMRTVCGYPAFAARVPEADAVPVARLRAAGAIIMGKTNVPPLARGIQTDNPVFGRTNNPWDVARTPGGSSGGAAAAIAAQLSYLELGSDIGGSIRIPAHFCGVWGLKCTGGLIPGTGHVASARPLDLPREWRPLLELGSFGPLARTVDDLRLAYDVLTRVADGGPDLRAEVGEAPVRVAWTDDLGGAPVDPEYRRLLAGLAARLRTDGVIVERRVPPDLSASDLWCVAGACLGAIDTLFRSRSARRVRALLAPLLTRLARSDLDRGLNRGASLHGAAIKDALARREAIAGRLEEFLSEVDVWMLPVFPTAAFTHRGRAAPIEVGGMVLSQRAANLLHCLPFNLTGHPVVTMPLGLLGSGLPVGVQLVGRRRQERALLRVAERIAVHATGYMPPPLLEHLHERAATVS